MDKKRSDFCGVEITCPNCGKKLVVSQYEIRKGRKYCSRECGYTRNHHVTWRSLEDRFWEKVVKTDTCWLWQGAQNTKGYGQIRDGKTRLAHRVAWELAHGRKLEKKEVLCHKCDTPLCVNPDHMFLGTKKDNTRDMLLKRRDKHRFSGKYAIVTPEMVVAIREEYSRGGITKTSIGHKYNLSLGHVSHIINKRSWKHI